MIASSPARPPPTSPIIEFPPTPMTYGFEATETLEDEMEKFIHGHALLRSNYEEKVRGTILKIGDSVRASIVYIYMKRILNILTDLKEGHFRPNSE